VYYGSITCSASLNGGDVAGRTVSTGDEQGRSVEVIDRPVVERIEVRTDTLVNDDALEFGREGSFHLARGVTILSVNDAAGVRVHVQ